MNRRTASRMIVGTPTALDEVAESTGPPRAPGTGPGTWAHLQQFGERPK